MNRTLTVLLMLAPAAVADGAGGGAAPPSGGTERPAGRVETLDFPDRLRASLRPDDPGIVLAYDLSFRLLGMTLFRLGEMRIEAMTGHMADDPAKTPACLLDCRMSPPPAADPRAVLRDRFVLLADAGGRKTLVFTQLADKSYRILGGRPKRYLRFDVNDYRGPEPYTYRTNLITGTSAARLGDKPGRERPGESVMALLNLLAEVHAGAQAGVDERSSPRFHAHVDGEVRPFVVRTSRNAAPGGYPREHLAALRADITSAPEAKTHRGRMSAWVLPFAEIAREAGHAVPATPARPPPVPIVPLAADVELAVGTVRAVLKSLAPAGGPPGDPAPVSAEGSDERRP
jgi:hypothetical protein